jgi:AraC family transcriptional regulator of arabinose operon
MGQHRPFSDIDSSNNGPLTRRDIADRRIFLAIKCIEAQEEFDEIAARLNLSPSRLRHLFKERTGWSLGQFSKEQKLRKAKRILEETFCSVKESAAIAGFSDLSHFVRDYKRRFGCRPSETPARACDRLAKCANK